MAAPVPPSGRAAPPSTPSLERRLGAYDAAAIVVSNVIGSGILITPAFIAATAPNAGAMLGAWLIGGFLAFAGAMAYAELAALRPKAGGEYVYLHEAYGPLAAFLTGWTSFVAGFAGAIAASAVGFASYMGRFFPAAADAAPFLSIPLGPIGLSVSPQALIALGIIWALSLVHMRGIGPGRLLQNALAVAKVVVLLGFVAAGLSIGTGSTEHFAVGTSATVGGLLLALIPVMFSYSGWNAAAYVAEEIRNPGRNVPLALAMGTLAVILVYLALNILYVYAMPVPELAGLQVRVVDAAADRLFGAGVGNLLAVITLFIVAGSISAMVFAGPRVYYAMARDGLFFSAAAAVHPTFRTPAVSIAGQAVWASLLVLSGTFGQLVDYTGFAVVLFAGVAVAGLFVLRRRHPDAPRPFKAWGYPVAPGLFVLASIALVLNSIWRNPGPSAAGLLVIAAGIPLYAFFRRQARALQPRADVASAPDA
jgi:APA family basic amino acid/polyamine antiporter